MQLQSRNYTPEEYLKLEAEAEYKSEYRDGEIIPMSRSGIGTSRSVCGS